MIYTPSIYIPIDRRHAMARGQNLPDRTKGAALFADISGFTPLTEALAKELGPRRGAEELSKQLNAIYGELIADLERFHGSVIGFSGDAITCWIEGDNGLRAVACALNMQQAMRMFAVVRTPSGAEYPLAIKVAVAAGQVRRFQVGNPRIQQWDVLAGDTLVRLAAAEHHATRGEVVISEEVALQLGDCLQIEVWREGENPGERFAVIAGLTCQVNEDPWPDLPLGALTEEMVKPWILPATFERVKSGQDIFEAELRPAVVLFLRFGGIDYDQDELAGDKLNAFVYWVQNTILIYDGALLQLTIGDKGSYLYVAFGAPVAHEDDVTRAVLSALQLRSLPPSLDFIDNVHIGISKGRMRVGPYGSPGRRTYGVLGDHTNLAARLMQQAAPGEVLVSVDVQQDVAEAFQWDACAPLIVKGKTDPITALRLVAPAERRKVHLQEPRYALPMVGRQAELALAQQKIDLALASQGQVIAITAEAGLGKSRLVAEIVRRGLDRQMDVYAGECQSFGANSSYLAWRDIWQTFFDINLEASVEEQVHSLESYLANVNPGLIPRLPLLGIVLNISIPDNELTQSMNARLRKDSLEALLVDCLRAKALTTPLLIVLEDCHWLDALSHDLVEVIGRTIVDLPVVLVITYRPPEIDRLQPPRVTSLPNCSVISLIDLSPEEAERLIVLKLGNKGDISPSFLEQITERAQGNPFYIEELINYLQSLGLNSYDQNALERLELPSSLHSLILSRIDQLGESQKIILKVASIIGRLFRFSWLWGVDPQLGEAESVQADLQAISNLDLTSLDQPDPEKTYLFKHIVTQEVAYESLPFATRALLHGNLGAFIEQTYSLNLEQYVDLLAYLYDLSSNDAKRREYLRKAGEAAQAAYANQSAINYFRRLLPLLPEEERGAILIKLGRVLERVGEWKEAGDLYREALTLAQHFDDGMQEVACLKALGVLLRKQGEYTEALDWLDKARSGFDILGDLPGLVGVLAEIGEVYRVKGNYAEAQERYLQSLTLANQIQDRQAGLAARAGVLKSAGTLANQQGTPDRAKLFYEDSLAIQRDLGDKFGVAALLNNLGMVAMFQEDYPTAQPLFAESLAILREIGDRWAIGGLLNNLGLVLRYLGKTETARQMLEESVYIRRALGDKWGIGNSLSSLTNLLIHLGQYQGVHEMLEESLLINVELGDKTAIAYCLEDFSSLAAGEGNPERALKLAGAAAGIREAIGSPLPSGEQAALDRTLQSAREAMNELQNAEIWEEGQKLTADEAIDYALKRK